MVTALVVLQSGLKASQATDWIREETSDISLTHVDPVQWITFMEQANAVLPVTLAQQKTSQSLTPADILLLGGHNSYNQTSAGTPIPQAFKDRFNSLVTEWQSSMMSETNGLSDVQYLVEFNTSYERFGNGFEQLEDLLLARQPHLSVESDLYNDYAFYAVVHFDQFGDMSIPAWYGLPESWRAKLLVNQMNHQAVRKDLGKVEPATNDLSQFDPYLKRIEAPSNFTMVYALPRAAFSSMTALDHYQNLAMNAMGLQEMVLIALGCALLIGLLPLERLRRKAQIAPDSSTGSELQLSPIRPRLPFEFWLAGVLATVALYLDFIYPFTRFSYTAGVAWNQTASLVKASFSPIALLFMTWLLVLFFWCGLAWFLMIAVRKGFADTFRRKSWIIRFLNWLHRFNPADRSDRSLIKIIVAHFCLLAIIVASAVFIGFYALILLFVYMLVISYLVKKQKDSLIRAYDQLFTSVRGMAQGNLNIQVDDHLGVFDPMKRELQRVREGFKRAVDEETKSQKMKSELVTNVSHDLKTPVTAILTYVNLLQQADLTEEDRKAYIEVLSGKSQRLSRLIEDLFEYTRASSGSTELAAVSVDLVELLKQAHIELEEKLTESGVQLRFHLPEHKVIVALDSEKTFRVFENLYLNIAKYAAPTSRSYVELKESENGVVVSFKNVSAAEMDFKSEEITERFVRGDRSRHTEGSGLGLAIVKSLVELQGGTFSIELDGDLFKAIIRWPTSKQQHTSG